MRGKTKIQLNENLKWKIIYCDFEGKKLVNTILT